jgi:hypothetical protein
MDKRFKIANKIIVIAKIAKDAITYYLIRHGLMDG